SCETSMPTKCASILSHPCLNGLRLQRPRRLFGFDGTADVDPCSPTGLVSPGGCGLASATAPTMIADAAGFDLQGVAERRRGLAGKQVSTKNTPTQKKPRTLPPGAFRDQNT